MIVRELDCAVYSEIILFYTDCTASKLVNHMHSKYKIPKSDMAEVKKHSRTIGFAHHVKNYFVIWYRTPTDLATLVHELYHLCTRIFDYKGIPISYENDEAMAYYMGHWMNRFLNVLKEEKANLV